MANLFSLAKSLYYTPTYRAGLLQAKAYRILKQKTALILLPYDLSTLDWALLGILNDTKDGRRMITLATILGVEAPLITRMVTKLEKKKLVRQKKDHEDVRAKVVTFTNEGRNQVKKIETILRKNIKENFKGISKRDLLRYLYVLEKIVANDEKNSK